MYIYLCVYDVCAWFRLEGAASELGVHQPVAAHTYVIARIYEIKNLWAGRIKDKRPGRQLVIGNIYMFMYT